MAPDQVDTTRTDAKVDETMNSTGMDEKPKDKPKEKKFKRKTSLWQGAPVAPVFTPDPNTTIEEQAQKENDFIGSGDYFNLKLDWTKDIVGGEYAIVFSCPLDNKGRTYGERETYKVNFPNNSISVWPTKAVGDDHWATGSIDFRGRTATFNISYELDEADVIATARVSPVDTPDAPKDMSCLLDKVMDFGILPLHSGGSRSTVSFGKKLLRISHAQNIGFDFVVLELATYDFEIDEPAKHMVVAVKIPELGNVPSNVVLNQVLSYPRDLRGLLHVPGHPPQIKLNQQHVRKAEGKKLSRQAVATYESGPSNASAAKGGGRALDDDEDPEMQ